METFPSSPHNHRRFNPGHSFMAGGALLFIVLGVLFSSLAPMPATAFGTGELFTLSNKERVKNGLPALAAHKDLNDAAQAKAEDMVKRDYFEHTAPDGTTGWGFITANGYIYSQAGENLAASNETEKAVVNGWMNSPGHRRNLLNAAYREVGYGVAFKDRFRSYENVYFIVALYAEPADNPTTVVAAGQDGGAPDIETAAGSLALTRRNPFVSPTLTFFVIGLSGALFLSGVLLEARRLQRHLAHARPAHHPSAR